MKRIKMLCLCNKIALFSVFVLLSACINHKDLYTEASTNYAQGNYRMMVEDLYKLATHGDVAAQYGLGYAYYNGIGVAQDRDTGRLWIKKAADADYPPAVIAYRRITNTDGPNPGLERGPSVEGATK
jgi:TPR repeat protein